MTNAHRLSVLLIVLALAACGEAPAEKKAAERDPAVTGALSEQIMVDPDLAQINPGSGALTGGGPPSANVPTELRSPEAIALAKAEAAKLVGGKFAAVPAVSTEGKSEGPLSLADLAGADKGNACAGKVDYTAAWAARMPAALPIYPRGHTREAAGTDRDGCRLRVVNFATPVSIDDVLAFYTTKARGAGLAVEHRIEGTDHVLGGSKGGAAYVVYARSGEDGLTDVDLVVNGL